MATMRLKLTAEDAERFGVTELEYDASRPRFSEVREMRKQLGMNLPEFGELAKHRNERDYVLGVVVWLALIRAGKKIAFEDFDCDVRGLVVERDEVEDPNSSAPDGANES